MRIEALLAAFEQYLELRRNMKEAASDCHEWDCGIANELSGGFGDCGGYDRLIEARAELEAALNRYIDERIQSVIEEKGSFSKL